MAKFDLNQTALLTELFTVDRAQRDVKWIQRFYEAIVDASMASLPKQTLQGPDGFPYFILNTPKASESFTPFCISHILDFCLTHGLGVVINPAANPPDWVFTYGQLWSL